MADLSSIEATEATRIVGSDSAGAEQTPVQSTGSGALHTNLRNASGTEVATAANPLRIDPTGTTPQPVTQSTSPWITQDLADGPVTPGTVATKSELAGGQYNTSLPSISNTQQIALQTNVFGRLKVDGSIQGSKSRIIDMNASSGGVARGTGIASTTTYTTVFSYTGSGTMFSFLVSLEGNLTGADAYFIKLEIDGVIIFEVSTLDLGTANLYNLIIAGAENTMGMSLDSNIFRFSSPRDARLFYQSSAAVSVKKATSATSKQFRAGLIYMTKDT